MKSKFLLAGLVLMSSTAMAHDLGYTLRQEGATQTVTCQSTDLGSAVDLYKAKDGKTGYVVLSSSDEDSGKTSETLTKVAVATEGHDVEIYANREIAIRIVTVGEGPTTATVQFRDMTSALKVWLKTYGQGADLKKATLSCDFTSN